MPVEQTGGGANRTLQGQERPILRILTYCVRDFRTRPRIIGRGGCQFLSTWVLVRALVRYDTTGVSGAGNDTALRTSFIRLSSVEKNTAEQDASAAATTPDWEKPRLAGRRPEQAICRWVVTWRPAVEKKWRFTLV